MLIWLLVLAVAAVAIYAAVVATDVNKRTQTLQSTSAQTQAELASTQTQVVDAQRSVHTQILTADPVAAAGELFYQETQTRGVQTVGRWTVTYLGDAPLGALEAANVQVFAVPSGGGPLLKLTQRVTLSLDGLIGGGPKAAAPQYVKVVLDAYLDPAVSLNCDTDTLVFGVVALSSGEPFPVSPRFGFQVELSPAVSSPT